MLELKWCGVVTVKSTKLMKKFFPTPQLSQLHAAHCFIAFGKLSLSTSANFMNCTLIQHISFEQSLNPWEKRHKCLTCIYFIRNIQNILFNWWITQFSCKILLLFAESSVSSYLPIILLITVYLKTRSHSATSKKWSHTLAMLITVIAAFNSALACRVTVNSCQYIFPVCHAT